MILGMDGRVITWHIGSGLATYTNNLLYNLQNLNEIKDTNLFYPYKNKTDLFNINNMPESLLKGERRLDFWNSMYCTEWNINYSLEIFHNTVNGIGLPKKSSARQVITMHDVIPYVMPETVDRPHLDYTFKNTPYIIEAVNHIITVSNFSKQDIQRYFGVDEKNISVTHLAADEIYKPLDRNKARNVIFNKYGIARSYILYLGGFSLRKNIARLIEAFKGILKETEKPMDLLILGEHSRSYNRLWSLTEKLGLEDNVKFLNFVPTSDLPYFYNGAEVFVYPSLYEGFGLPPLEAMQCGTPVVTSNVSSIPEIVGDACMLINPYSVEEIASAVVTLVENNELWNKYSKLGIEKAMEYSWEKTAEKTLSIYKKCLNE